MQVRVRPLRSHRTQTVDGYLPCFIRLQSHPGPFISDEMFPTSGTTSGIWAGQLQPLQMPRKRVGNTVCIEPHNSALPASNQVLVHHYGVP